MQGGFVRIHSLVDPLLLNGRQTSSDVKWGEGDPKYKVEEQNKNFNQNNRYWTFCIASIHSIEELYVQLFSLEFLYHKFQSHGLKIGSQMLSHTNDIPVFQELKTGLDQSV